MEVIAIFGRFVWRGVNIVDVAIHPSRGSKINPTLKVCEHNRVSHASHTYQATAEHHWQLMLWGGRSGEEDECGAKQTRQKLHGSVQRF